MPVCHRCERMLPTVEVRRTMLGHLCKDNGTGSRCWTLARALNAARRAKGREDASATRGAEAS